MSLFSSREWWSTRLGTAEEFDQGSIAIANIDNDPNGNAKIITGSLQGMLRVHLPHQRGYHVEDMLLETELEGSILQLAAGNFLGSSSICLAVLHPRKLAVYALQAVGSSYLQHSKIYEHYLEHTAANMATGPFGGIAGVEHIVVQSYDGQLTFFEQEAMAFSRFLPSFLLPGPLAYAAASDSFITSTAGLELVAYKYSNLAAASGSKEQQQQQQQAGGPPAGAVSGKRIQADWTVVLGEAALDIRTGRITANTRADAPADILVLAEHTFFVLNLQGQLLLQRRLDYHPACCWPFPAGPDSSSSSSSATANPNQQQQQRPPENLLVATHTKALMVYRGQELAWAARLEMLPVAVRVAALEGMQGMIVALDDTGKLSVLYLGSEPPKQSVSFAESKQLDYAAMEAERKALLTQIKAAGGAGWDPAATAPAAAAGKGAAAAAKDLVLRAQVPSRLDDADRIVREGGEGPPGSNADGVAGFGAAGGAAAAGVKQLTVTLLLSNTTKSSMKDVSISIQVPAPVVALQQQLLLPELPPSSSSSSSRGPGEPLAVQVVLQVPAGSSIPAANTAEVVACYRSADKQLQCSQLALQLPMILFCQVIPPVKSAEYKVTVATNRDAAQLVALFGDMLVQAHPAHAEALSRSQAANVMSFHFGGGQEVTILVSKNAGRYRLQADSFAAMWLVLQELSRRLAGHFAAAEAKPAAAQQQQQPPPFSITFEESLPLQDVFELVDRHFALRAALAAANEALEQREVQFRSVQKRLLVRYKDRNAAPLNQLDVLMEETYDQILDLATQMEQLQAELLAAGQALGAGVQLLLLLTRFRFKLAAEESELLRCALSPVVLEGPEVSWEETTEAAMTHLLRSALARSAKDAAAAVPPLAPAADTARLKKHISLVLERLSKGMRLVAGSSSNNGGSAAAVAAH
uniref:PTHB1 N-terminal domain-containing protein n=1 Tax=Tetradesmus obliquus TaxID=3088 RepID=A0A383VDZ0_TETOB|eukprot:jgi/Sobl393_1/3562/SZX63765.1